MHLLSILSRICESLALAIVSSPCLDDFSTAPVNLYYKLITILILLLIL